MKGVGGGSWTLAPFNVQEFIFQEASLLNNSAFERWLSCYTPDASYWMPADWGQEDAQDHVSLINDSRQMMEVRVKRLRHPKLYSQQPLTRAVRLVSNIFVVADAPNTGLIVSSSFLCMLHRLRSTQIVGGTYEHHIRREQEQMRIFKKVVRLVNSDVPLSHLGVPL